MAGDDRLSGLSDDLLQRILHFVSSKESASTSVLSRRWGSLWRSSGAVNLAVRIPSIQRSNDPWGNRGHEAEAAAAFFSCHEAFARAAGAALAAAAATVTRLTLRVETDAGSYVINNFLDRGAGWSTHGNLANAVLSHPKAAHVEKLRVALVDTASDASDGLSDAEVYEGKGLYKPVPLPSSETLRVLDLTRCDLEAPAVFPRLATLRLRLCSLQLEDLQALLDAAPELATVHLDSVFFTLPPDSQREHYNPARFRWSGGGNTAAAEPAMLGLRLRAVTTLVLASCGREVARDHRGNIGGWDIEIDAPRLRSFVYKGFLRRLELRSPAPDLALVDLHFLNSSPSGKRYAYRKDGSDKERTRKLFWQFLHNFTNARALKLKVNCDLKDIAAIGRARCAELLCTFPNAERLELEGVHRPASKTAAVAISNLLHCCPVVRDLTLKLSTVPPHSQKDADYGRPFLERKDRLDYSKSIDRFTRRSSKTAIAVEDSCSSCDGYDDVPDIPGLTGHSFACLHSSLRRVSLKFQLGDSISSCFGRRLIKFFAENAMGLEEMCVDSGNRRLYEHVNFIVATKACFGHRNVAEGSCESSRIPNVSVDSTTDDRRSTSGFAVLPLRR